MRCKNLAVIAVLAWLLAPAVSVAAWQVVATEQGKRVEIERESIVTNENNEAMAKGRIVLDKPIVDPRTAVAYRVIEVLNRFDCKERSYATLNRSYYKDGGDLLRQEEAKFPFDMPVRSGTPDDKLLREVCRPKPVTNVPAGQALEKVNDAAAELRQLNDELIQKEVRKDVKRLADQASAALGKRSGQRVTVPKEGAHAGAQVAWSYAGAGGPDYWGSLKTEYSVCASGRRQSPIDIRDGIAVDTEPLQFFYRPSSFRVVDSGKNLQVLTHGGGLGVLGKSYVLSQAQFRRPSEMSVAGKFFDMEVQLLHRADDGRLAIVSILLEKGPENPVIQQVLNNLPLERHGDVAPPAENIDLERLLPANRAYYTFMGSLTTPPCTEEVLWLVLKQPQPISAAQLAIFARLYPPNARPLQPSFDRIIKESR